MRRSIKLPLLLALILLLSISLMAKVTKEETVIESRLFKGMREEGRPGTEITISSYSEPFIVPLHPSIIESENNFVARLKKELIDIYQLKDVELLAKGSMIWDGKKERLNNTILLEKLCYFVDFFPNEISKGNINLRINIQKIKFEKLSLEAEKAVFVDRGEKRLGLLVLPSPKKISLLGSYLPVLDTELTVNLNEPVVLGFPSNGDPYFLSLFVAKKDLSHFVEVGGVAGGVIGGVKGGVLGGVKGGVIGGVEGGLVGKIKGGVKGGVLGGVIGGATYFSIIDTDPVCNKEVARGKILEIDKNRIKAEESTIYNGKRYFFCSKECLDKFMKHPELYLNKESKLSLQEIESVRTKVIPVKQASQTEVDIRLPTPVQQVKPLYPEKCKKEKIEGSVILEVGIDEEGNVINVRVLKSVHPDLDNAALDSVKKWKYKPVIKGEEPVPVVFAVTVNFWLRE